MGAGPWKSTGTPGLDYWYLNNDVETCCQFALVKQKLEYKYWDWFLQKDVKWSGGYNRHEF